MNKVLINNENDYKLTEADDTVDIDKLNLLWKNIETIGEEFELSLDKDIRKSTGSYYTGLNLSMEMIEQLFSRMNNNFIENIENKTFLEPCVGVGNFVFSYLRKIYESKYTIKKVRNILENIYVCDINVEALDIYQDLLKDFVLKLWGITLDKDYFDNHIKDGLLYNVTETEPSYIELDDIFKDELSDMKFDIIITNPPYKNLKAERNKFKDKIEFEKEKNKYSMISKDVKKKFKYSTKGILNLYKLFVEKIITDYSKKDAYISLLVPSSILGDKTCENLRTYILLNHKIFHISIINEKNDFIKAQQSLCTLVIKKNKENEVIDMVPDYCNDPGLSTEISIKDILNESTNNSIFALTPKEYETFKKIQRFPTLKDFDFIVNMRGELDLTSNKKYIGAEKTAHTLLRGRNIGYFDFDSNSNEYVDPVFVEKATKKEYIKKSRIICQQVVNIKKERRVSFTYIPEDFVLGNSCNFISVKNNEYDIDLYELLGLFNSPIINWFFKLTSTNNHINNYEIDMFPIPINAPELKEIGILTKKYMETKDIEILNEIYKLSYDCYDISSNEDEVNCENDVTEIQRNLYEDLRHVIPSISIGSTKLLLDDKITLESLMTDLAMALTDFEIKTCNHIINKYQKKNREEIFNHTTFKLSDLDLEMIKTVPQGGNWKDIHPETIKKSRRLVNITKTGGRTTLYGRIDYSKPVYTVTTYFNRPGNGTYVHPIHERVLSVREAARLQSFKDDYFFYGNQTQLLKQVGNAVPPMLAYRIGKAVHEKTGCNTSIDLFCGAGGMTSGFKESGIKSIMGVDFEESACVTFKANNPETKVLCADITKSDIKKDIIKTAKKNEVDIICGGPPCQGFSHAGKRFIDDPRNEMFKHFVEVVEGANPKVVIMENVQGMITFKKGAVYRQIIELFTSLGYKTVGKILFSHHHGVPQKRKRVIITCVRNDLEIDPETLFPHEVTEKEEYQVTALDAIKEFEDIECSIEAKYDKSYEKSNYAKELLGNLSFGNYVDYIEENEYKSINKQLSLL